MPTKRLQAVGAECGSQDGQSGSSRRYRRLACNSQPKRIEREQSEFHSRSAAQAGDAVESGVAQDSQPESTQTAAEVLDPNQYREQLLGGLANVDIQDPQQLIGQLQKIDMAIQDLMSASANNVINENTFIDNGLALGKLKLASAEQLAGLAGATAEQRKTGQLAQLVALSHLSGFRDVESAKQLEKYALELSQSQDLDLAHQSRIVLMGFQLQALQNGLTTDPNELLAQAEGLFQRAEDRNFPELMMLMQANQVLGQMGYTDAAQRMNEILVQEFADSADPQLRTEAWNIQTRGSQALDNYLTAFRSLGSPQFDPTSAIAAARGLYEAFPSVQTLEQLAGTVTNIEYSGNIELSRMLVELIAGYQSQLPAEASTTGISSVLSGHSARLSLLGQPLSLNGIVGFDGTPFDASSYAGKVVLVDFWATWCVPCLREIPEIRKAYENLHGEGFEVISINMDEDLQQARKFLDKQRFPWATYHSNDLEALGFKAAYAQRLGISAIPFMLLVDREGKVAAIHVRGEKLTPTIRQMLGLPTSLIPEE